MYLIQNIRYLRKLNRLSQTVLGQRVGKSKEIISTYERGKIQPPIDVVYEMSKLFGIVIEDMLIRDLEKESTDGTLPLKTIDPSSQTLQRLNELLESRVKVLERELKKIAPDVAGELGIL